MEHKHEHGPDCRCGVPETPAAAVATMTEYLKHTAAGIARDLTPEQYRDPAWDFMPVVMVATRQGTALAGALGMSATDAIPGAKAAVRERFPGEPILALAVVEPCRTRDPKTGRMGEGLCIAAVGRDGCCRHFLSHYTRTPEGVAMTEWEEGSPGMDTPPARAMRAALGLCAPEVN